MLSRFATLVTPASGLCAISAVGQRGFASRARQLEGKTVIVTGATSGIGYYSALECAQEGANVVACGRREDRGKQLVDAIEKAGGIGMFVRADMSKESDCHSVVDAAMERFGALHGAFNNAGSAHVLGPVESVPSSAWQELFQLNFYGVLHSMQAQIKAMRETGAGGSIVNCSSIAGRVGMEMMGVYCSTKHAVQALSKVAAAELAPANIRVNNVLPGPIYTEIFEKTSLPMEAVEAFPAMTKLGRWGQSSEVAKPVVFLLSDASSYVTGTDLVVDGGFLEIPFPAAAQ